MESVVKPELTLAWIAIWMGTACLAQSSAKAGSASATPVRKKVYVSGKPLPADRVLVKDGTTYVDLSAFAAALGASVDTEEGRVVVTPAKPGTDCDKPSVEGQRFSPQFRGEVAAVADEIESLRAVVSKKEKVPLGPRFDAIDRQLTLATAHVQTDADMAVYYALSYANNSLAIAYYKLSRGVPLEEAQKNQVDSMICSMESKFALMKGVLMPGGNCSVFRRIEGQQTPPTTE
jgi:hypothetical protein